MAEPIERRSGLSKEEFLEQYALPKKPVILTDAAAGWPALDWTPESLAEAAPQATIRATPTAARSNISAVEMSLREYVDYLKEPDARKLYMTSWAFRTVAPQLLEGFEVPEYFADDWLQDLDDEARPDLLWIFLGPGRSGLFMHVDIGHTAAWNVQLSGRKSWVLFSPGQEQWLYDGQVDAFNPDLERFPDFAKTDPIRCEVGPGECIYAPSGWWHQTRNIDQGMALTANYVDQTNHEEVLAWLRKAPGYEELYRRFRKVARRRLRS